MGGQFNRKSLAISRLFNSNNTQHILFICVILCAKLLKKQSL